MTLQTQTTPVIQDVPGLQDEPAEKILARVLTGEGSDADTDQLMGIAAPSRGSVQTVRMDRRTLKALKDAAFDRGISQQEIMLTAIRKDLGVEQP